MIFLTSEIALSLIKVDERIGSVLMEKGKKMTISYLMNTLEEASDYICKIAENKALTDEDFHKIGDILAIMYRFISNTEFED